MASRSRISTLRPRATSRDWIRRGFSAHAEVARTTCPVSKALAGVDISLTASLVEKSAGIGPRRSAALRAAQQARAHVMTRRGSERFRRAR